MLHTANTCLHLLVRKNQLTFTLQLKPGTCIECNMRNTQCMYFKKSKCTLYMDCTCVYCNFWIRLVWNWIEGNTCQTLHWTQYPCSVFSLYHAWCPLRHRSYLAKQNSFVVRKTEAWIQRCPCASGKRFCPWKGRSPTLANSPACCSPSTTSDSFSEHSPTLRDSFQGLG